MKNQSNSFGRRFLVSKYDEYSSNQAIKSYDFIQIYMEQYDQTNNERDNNVEVHRTLMLFSSISIEGADSIFAWILHDGWET